MIDYAKELEKTVAELPQQPPPDTVRYLQKAGFFKEEALVYKAAWIQGENGTKEKVAQVHCTACGEVMHLEHVPFEEPCGHRFYGFQAKFGYVDPNSGEVLYHNKVALCPTCGAQADVIHISSFGGEFRTLQETRCMSVHVVRGNLCLLKWGVFKNTDKNGVVSFRSHKVEGFIVIGKKKFRVCGFSRSNINHGYYHDWEIRKSYKELFGSPLISAIVPFEKELIYRTSCENSAFYEYICACKHHANPSLYLRLWLRYPQIENLVRAGFGALLNHALDDARETYYYTNAENFNINKIDRLFDLKKVKPADILKITKQEFAVAKKCDLYAFGLYQYLREERAHRLSAECVEKAALIGALRLRVLLQDYPSAAIVRTINYLRKQKDLSVIVDPRYLGDYWKMLENVYGEIPATLRYPKDLVKAHDEVLKLQEEKEEKELSEKIAAHADQYSDLIYEDEDLHLMIRPCRSQKELIDEGNALDHCVARYAEAVANGKTMIFFIRKTDAPDVPFFTLEYKDGVVEQNRGKSNCARTKEVQLFEQLWLDKIQNIRRKKDGKHGNSECAAS